MTETITNHLEKINLLTGWAKIKKILTSIATFLKETTIVDDWWIHEQYFHFLVNQDLEVNNDFLNSLSTLTPESDQITQNELVAVLDHKSNEHLKTLFALCRVKKIQLNGDGLDDGEREQIEYINSLLELLGNELTPLKSHLLTKQPIQQIIGKEALEHLEAILNSTPIMRPKNYSAPLIILENLQLASYNVSFSDALKELIWPPAKIRKLICQPKITDNSDSYIEVNKEGFDNALEHCIKELELRKDEIDRTELEAFLTIQKSLNLLLNRSQQQTDNT